MIYELDHYEAYHDSLFRVARQRLWAHATAAILALSLSLSGPPAPAAVPAFRQRDYPPHTFVKARRQKFKGYQKAKRRG